MKQESTQREPFQQTASGATAASVLQQPQTQAPQNKKSRPLPSAVEYSQLPSPDKKLPSHWKLQLDELKIYVGPKLKNQGGMSTVLAAGPEPFKSCSEARHSPWVLKMLPRSDGAESKQSSSGNTATLASRLCAEAEHMQTMQDANLPNIPKVIRRVGDQDNPAILMERAPGNSLALTLLHPTLLTLEDRQAIILKVVETLIQMKEKCNLYPLDFDLSQCIVKKEKKTNTIALSIVDHAFMEREGSPLLRVGKPQIWPPELFLPRDSRPSVSEAIVVWQLGVFILESADPKTHLFQDSPVVSPETGEIDWAAYSSQRQSHFKTEIPRRCDLLQSAELRSLVQAMLATNPTLRPTLRECQTRLQTIFATSIDSP